MNNYGSVIDTTGNLIADKLCNCYDSNKQESDSLIHQHYMRAPDIHVNFEQRISDIENSISQLLMDIYNLQNNLVTNSADMESKLPALVNAAINTKIAAHTIYTKNNN